MGKARYSCRFLRCIAMVAVCAIVGGCIWIPPVWDAADEVNLADQIEEGVTTKEEVIQRLGEPDSEHTWKGINYVHYYGYESAGIVCYGFGFGAAECSEPVKESRWDMTIAYDDDDVVESVGFCNDSVVAW